MTMDAERHEVDKWDLVIAHPPCTYMSNAGACRMYPHKGQIDKDRYAKAMAAKEFFMQFYNFHCDRVAVENPLPMKNIELPKPTQIIQPYEFGEPYSKKTLLWLRGLAPLKPTKILSDYIPWIASNTGAFSRGQGGSRGVARTAQLRSKTFAGIAEAMAEQWGG